MRRAILPGLALLAAMPAAAGRGRWTIAGPPKAASLVVADPVRRGIVYASLGLPGQVWRSTDDGRSWTATGSPAADSIGLDPSDADVLYVGGLDVFRSSDRGGTWEEIVPDLTASSIRNIVVAPDDTNVLYVEAHTLAAEPGGQDTYRFARVRRESGGSWDWSVPDPGFTTQVAGLVADASSSGTIFASGVGGVYRSKDGGDSWTTLATGIPPDTWAEKPAIHSGAPSWLYVPIATTTLPAHGVAVSRDGGDSWTIETDGLPDGPLKCAAVDPRDPEIAYAASAFAGVFRSIDGGRTWQGFDAGLFTPAVFSLAVGATGRVYAGTPDGVFVVDPLEIEPAAPASPPAVVRRR